MGIEINIEYTIVCDNPNCGKDYIGELGWNESFVIKKSGYIEVSDGCSISPDYACSKYCAKQIIRNNKK